MTKNNESVRETYIISFVFRVKKKSNGDYILMLIKRINRLRGRTLFNPLTQGYENTQDLCYIFHMGKKPEGPDWRHTAATPACARLRQAKTLRPAYIS